VPMGGPDGGDGGRGGDVIIEADEGLTTLAHFRRRRIYKAGAGVSGSGQKRHGANGKDLVLKVPVGTIIQSDDASWDLDEHGARRRGAPSVAGQEKRFSCDWSSTYWQTPASWACRTLASPRCFARSRTLSRR